MHATQMDKTFLTYSILYAWSAKKTLLFLHEFTKAGEHVLENFVQIWDYCMS